jgi:hypothetical protein
LIRRRREGSRRVRAGETTETATSGGKRKVGLKNLPSASIICPVASSPGLRSMHRRITVFPHFIGIGAQKAGTTWLHRNLQVHPQIFMPRKEVHYFDRKIDDRSNAMSRLFGKREVDRQWRRQARHWLKVHMIDNFSLEKLLWDLKYYMRPYNDEWYASVFEPSEGRVTGEITPAYSALDRDRVAYVHEIVPEAKIIFMMRNPIERVWSQAVMSFDKAEKGSAGSVSEKKFLRRIERDSFRLLTNYSRTLDTWQQFYAEEQIFIGFLEDIRFFPKELLRCLCEFLGVDPSFTPPEPDKKIHSRSEDRMPAGVAVHLARTYQEEMERLNKRFGGYASFWLYCAERLIEDPPAEGHVPYPLWESGIWEEWIGGSAPGSQRPWLQSGPLSFVQDAR